MDTTTAEESSSDDDEGYQLSQRQLMINEIAPRVTGTIAFLSAVCMICVAWKRKDRVFHRLVLGMALHILIEGAFLIYGSAAIPASDSTTIALGNAGTTLTCTIQGFFIYLCSFTATLYYASFSVYSLVGVLCNFNKTKYQWIEKWIHIGVHIFSIGMSIFILCDIGFGPLPYGFCYHHDYGMSMPLNITMFVLPLILYIVIPTVVMVTLFCIVKHRPEGQIHISAKAVAIQSVIYLIAMYWTTLPVYSTLFFFIDVTPSNHKILYPYIVFGLLNYSLFGLWSMVSYLFFSVKNTIVKSPSTAATLSASTSTANLKIQNKNNGERQVEEGVISQFIFGSHEIQIQAANNNPTTTTTSPVNARVTATTERNYSFNIFDGTNASGAFAEFVQAGDSDDERNDNEQTVHWGGDVQNHI
jgi:hypothetical protein